MTIGLQHLMSKCLQGQNSLDWKLEQEITVQRGSYTLGVLLPRGSLCPLQLVDLLGGFQT